MAIKPTIFLGSSSEALDVAYKLQGKFVEFAVVKLWKEGVFELGQPSLDSLQKALHAADFAVLVMASDDVEISRHTKKAVPRDNVLLEFGLALGVLGSERCYYVADSSKNVKLPSDLLGITGALYDSGSADSLDDALQSASVKIRERAVQKGKRARIEPAAIETHQRFEAFCDGLVGKWWECVTPGDASALSYMTVTRNPDTGTVRIVADAYDNDGTIIARWESDAVCVSPARNALRYLWVGKHPGQPGAAYEGFGEIVFRDGLQSGSGEFSSVNAMDLKTLRKKSTELVRCSEREVKDMEERKGDAVAATVKKRLAQIKGALAAAPG